MPTYQARSARLLTRVIKDDYYVERLESKVGPLPAFEAKLPSMSAVELRSIWNSFWARLPDSMAIRTALFFELCDLCEESPDDQP